MTNLMLRHSAIVITFYFFDISIIKLTMILRYSSVNNFQNLFSRKEMSGISNEISKRFTPVKPVTVPELNSDTKLSSKELLEVSQNISRYFAPNISSTSKKLALLPIDPQHLYAYWSLGDNQTNKISQMLIEGQLALRIYSKSDGNQDAVKARPVLEIAISEVQARQRIRLPAVNGAVVYSASIGEYVPDNGFVSLLESNYTHAIQGVEEYKDSKNTSNDSSHVEYKETQATLYDNLSFVTSPAAGTNKSGHGKK